jgi:hypothetical protein
MTVTENVGRQWQENWREYCNEIVEVRAPTMNPRFRKSSGDREDLRGAIRRISVPSHLPFPALHCCGTQLNLSLNEVSPELLYYLLRTKQIRAMKLSSFALIHAFLSVC